MVGRSTSDRPPTEAAMITPPRSSRACLCSSRRPLPTNTTLQPRRADQCRQGTTAKCSRTSSRCSSRCPRGWPPAVAARTPAGSSPPSARKRCLVEHGAGQKVASRFPAVGLFTVFRSQQRRTVPGLNGRPVGHDSASWDARSARGRQRMRHAFRFRNHAAVYWPGSGSRPLMDGDSGTLGLESPASHDDRPD